MKKILKERGNINEPSFAYNGVNRHTGQSVWLSLGDDQRKAMLREGIDAVAQGTAVIDAGHYGLEHIFIKDMTEYLNANLEEVQVDKVAISHPFHIL